MDRPRKTGSRHCFCLLPQAVRASNLGGWGVAGRGQAALGILARSLHCSQQAFGFCGTKDKRAVTEQAVTAHMIHDARMAGLNRTLKWGPHPIGSRGRQRRARRAQRVLLLNAQPSQPQRVLLPREILECMRSLCVPSAKITTMGRTMLERTENDNVA